MKQWILQKNKKPILFVKFFASVIDESLKLLTNKLNSMLKIPDMLIIQKTLQLYSNNSNNNNINMNNSCSKNNDNTNKNENVNNESSGFDVILFACQQAGNNTTHSGNLQKKTLLTKLDLLETWNRLYNGCNEYGNNYHELLLKNINSDAFDHDIEDTTGGGISGIWSNSNSNKRKDDEKGESTEDNKSPMEIIHDFGNRMDINVRIDLIINHDFKDIRNDCGYEMFC